MSLLINKVGKLSIILVVNLTCGLLALLLMFIQVPSILSYMYVGMILSGLSISVVNSSSVELFPTKMRFVIKFLFSFYSSQTHLSERWLFASQ